MPVHSARSDLPAELTGVSFVGRQVELAHLCRMLEQARQGRPGLVMVEGSAGIGKTALVRRFLEVAGELCVLWASGEEAEIGLSLGVLGQLASLVPAALPHLLPAKLQGDEQAVDPLAAGAALVDLLGELQDDASVVLVIDDAHWADHPSLQAERPGAGRPHRRLAESTPAQPELRAGRQPMTVGMVVM